MPGGRGVSSRTFIKTKNVLVVGGGPAGMEAARISALIGHKITLWEKDNKLGGLLNLAAVPPLREKS